MKSFFALLRLQLLSRYSDLKPQNWKRLDPQQRKRSIRNLIIYAFVFVYLGGFLFFLETKAIDLLLKMGNPPIGMADLLLIAATAVSMIGTLVLSFFFVMSSLYLGRDSVFLAALPVKPRIILAARLCQIWISETLINAIIILPACLLFGIRTGQNALFYLRMLLVWMGCPILAICVGTVFGTLLVRASALIRHREAIMTVGGLALMVLYFYVVMNMGGLAGDSGAGGEMLANLLQSYAGRIQSFTGIFPPAGWAVQGLLGDWGQLALFLAVSLGAVALLILILGVRYRELSLIQAETPVATGRKGLKKDAFSSDGGALKALARREIRQILRVPSYATNILPVCLMPALMIVLMGVFISQNLEPDAPSMEILLAHVPGALVLAGLTGFICFMADMNPALSTAVTREGRGHDFMLALPVPVRTHVMSKMVAGYGLTALGIALSIIALIVQFPQIWMETLMSGALCLLFTYSCSCLALARDLKKPRLNWVTEQEAVKQNIGVLISMVQSVGFLVALGGISYLLIGPLECSTWLYFGCMAALLAVGCFFAHRYMMKTGEKYYLAQ